MGDASVQKRQEPAGDPAHRTGAGLLPDRRYPRHRRDSHHSFSGDRLALCVGKPGRAGGRRSGNAEIEASRGLRPHSRRRATGKYVIFRE